MHEDVQATTPTGSDAPAYIGHRLPGDNIRGARPDLHPAAIGMGKTALPQGLQHNEGVLLGQGRIEQSTHVAYRDWQAANVHRSTVAAKNFLFSIAPPYKAGQHLGEGDQIFNPYGVSIPRHLKSRDMDALAHTLENGSPQEIQKAAKEMLDGFTYVEGQPHGDLQTTIERWARDAGVSFQDVESKLRVLNSATAKRFYERFGRRPPTGPYGTAYDHVLNYTALSIIFGRLG